MKPIQIYKKLYHEAMGDFYAEGMSADKANRLANIYAVKNTWRVFNKQKKIGANISSMEFY